MYFKTTLNQVKFWRIVFVSRIRDTSVQKNLRSDYKDRFLQKNDSDEIQFWGKSIMGICKVNASETSVRFTKNTPLQRDFGHLEGGGGFKRFRSPHFEGRGCFKRKFFSGASPPRPPSLPTNIKNMQFFTYKGSFIPQIYE